ncbi:MULTISPECIES: hypothetical protein [Nostoc]|uniref:hypothetical protein n=1 Tax=Nostoc TaxID=1177 RepID=UPI001F556DC2|nr:MULTISPECIES: hypothetical protein [Nostoc]
MFHLLANALAICVLNFLMPNFFLWEHHTNDILLSIYTAMCSVHGEMVHEAFRVSEAYRRYRVFLVLEGIYLETTSILNRLILQTAQPYRVTPF